jgi:hypothetical protein
VGGTQSACRNTFLGYQVELPEGLFVTPQTDLIGRCEALGTGATQNLPPVEGLLSQDIVFTKLDMTVHEFFQRIEQPPRQRQTTVLGHPAEVVEIEVTVNVGPSYPAGTYVYMYVVDLGRTTFVVQLAVPPSRRDSFRALQGHLDQLTANLKEIPTTCTNSLDPRCGPFYFDPDAGPNADMAMSVQPDPVSARVGEPVTFNVSVSDADAPLLEVYGRRFGDEPTDADVKANVVTGMPEIILLVRHRSTADGSPHGPWVPPAREAGQSTFPISHTYARPGVYTAVFSARSSSRGAPPFEDPYMSFGEVSVTVTVT